MIGGLLTLAIRPRRDGDAPVLIACGPDHLPFVLAPLRSAGSLPESAR
ncbi:hypothetical protein [Kitasatospora purpeofusca]